MHTLSLTPDMMYSVQRLTLRSIPTRADLSHTPVSAITDGNTVYRLVGARVRRAPLSSLSKAHLSDIRMVSHDMLLSHLGCQEQPEGLDTIISLVEWDHLDATTTPCTESYVRSYLAPDASDSIDPLALEAFVRPLATAKDGDAMAISLPHGGRNLCILHEDLNLTTIRVLRKTTSGAIVTPLHAMPPTFVAQALAWAHTVNINHDDFYGAVASQAMRRTRAYTRTHDFHADVFFCTDRVMVVTDAPHRLVLMAIGNSFADPPSAHHVLAMTTKVDAALHALRSSAAG